MIVNRVSLNIPHLGAGGDLPRPGQPILTIDGHTVHNIKSLKVEAGYNRASVVTISFEAEVEGDLEASVEGLSEDPNQGRLDLSEQMR